MLSMDLLNVKELCTGGRVSKCSPCSASKGLAKEAYRGNINNEVNLQIMKRVIVLEVTLTVDDS